MNTTKLFLIIGGFLCVAVSNLLGAEIKLRPVGASGVHSFSGNQVILYGADQTITLEIRTGGWTGLLNTYTVKIDCAGYSSGTSGVLAPAALSCPSTGAAGHAFCQNTFGDMGTGASKCVDVDPGAGVALQCQTAWVNQSRTDWVFFGAELIVAAVPPDLCVNQLGAVVTPQSAVPSGGIEKYCGTIVLQVPAGAQGEFTIGFIPGSGITFLANENNDEITPLFLTPAIITIAPPPAYGACCDHALPGGECMDNVAEPDCLAMGEESEFFKGQSCAEIEVAGLCEEHTGVCCDHAAPGGECMDNIAESICLATGEQTEFFPGQSCEAAESAGMCEEHTGACCVERVCTDNVARSACASERWFKGALCDAPGVAESCAEQQDLHIPTVSGWGLIILTLLLLVGGMVYFGQRRFVI